MQGKKPPAEPLNWEDIRLFLALCRAPTLGEAAVRFGFALVEASPGPITR